MPTPIPDAIKSMHVNTEMGVDVFLQNVHDDACEAASCTSTTTSVDATRRGRSVRRVWWSPNVDALDIVSIFSWYQKKIRLVGKNGAAGIPRVSARSCK